jgi:putative hemolysin
MRPRKATIIATTAAAAMLATFIVAGGGTAAPALAAQSKAAKYCKSKGGKVETRRPAYGTNDPSTQVVLTGTRSFCRFTANDEAQSRIYVDLQTLYSTKPTLAAAAYLTKPPVGDVPPSVNPASIYCSKLGGSDSFGGVNAAGGGWVIGGNSPDPVLQACVFPDLSIIDSWGLTYNANGDIRGIDLRTVLRWTPQNVPIQFGT